MILTIVLISSIHVMLIFFFWRLGKKIFNHLHEIDMLNYKIMENHYKYHSDSLEMLRLDLKNELIHLQAIIIQIPKKDREGRKKGGNPRRRTAEEKRIQSMRRKEWWERKRRMESETSSGAPLITPQAPIAQNGAPTPSSMQP